MFRYIGDAAGAEACENEKQESDCKGTAGGLHSNEIICGRRDKTSCMFSEKKWTRRESNP